LLSFGSARSLPAAVRDNIDGFVTERMAAWSTPGLSLIIVEGDEVIYSRGYGFADLERERLMTENTPVVLGSTTKAMTTLAVMQLVEAGKVELDAPVTRYLLWFGIADARGADITVRHILSHSSGFPWGDLFSGRADQEEELEAYVRSLADVTLEAAPGSRYGYSNDTFTIAGLIVQTVSGMAYEDYMYKNVFGPLEMNRTTFDVALAESWGLAQGYRNEYGVAAPYSVPFTDSENPAGKVMTSSAELGNYFIMLLNGGRFGGARIVSEASLAEMWTPVVPVEEGISYGMAWYLVDVGAMRFVSHPGSVRTSGSRFVLVPEARLGVGVLSNISRPLDPRNEVAESVALATLLFGDAPLRAPPAREAPASYVADPAAWREVVGVYASAAGPVRIFLEGDRLLGTVYGYSFELEPHGDLAFTVRSDFARLDGADLTFQAADPTVQSWLAGDDRLLLLGQLFAFKSE
jgi:CubicO group peptidase (beta-lactamase class C family)